MEEYTVLADKARQGDAHSFACLYEMIYEDLFRFASYTLRSPQDAQDAVSEAVCDAYRDIRKLRSAEAFRGWMFRILSRKCKKKIRQYKNQTVPLPEELPVEGHDPGEAHDVRMAFTRLTEEERLIISMQIFAGYNSAETGNILRINPATVRSKQKRALDKMREYL